VRYCELNSAVNPVYAINDHRVQRNFRVRADAMARTPTAKTEFDRRGHSHIRNVLNGESARALYRWLRDDASWGLKLCNGERVLGVPPSEYSRCTSSDLRGFADIAYTAARLGFAFMREEIWCSSATMQGYPEGGHVVAPLLDLLNSDELQKLIVAVTGYVSTRLLKVAIERHKPGHFCTFNNGSSPSARLGVRLDLTPAWQVDWGGLCEFTNFFGAVDAAYRPEFNSLTIYSLSRPQGISFVAPFARAARYTVVCQLAASNVDEVNSSDAVCSSN
jgi:SM-20-related protein